MDSWLSIAEISKNLGLAENTARRYANLFSDYLVDRRFGRAIKYKSDSINVLGRVAALYQDGLGTDEIREKIHEEFPAHIDHEDEAQSGRSVPALIQESHLQETISQLTEQMNAMKENQEHFNRELLKRLDDQHRYIENSIKRRDEQLTTALREIQENKKQLAAGQEKKWWRLWQK